MSCFARTGAKSPGSSPGLFARFPAKTSVVVAVFEGWHGLELVLGAREWEVVGEGEGGGIRVKETDDTRRGRGGGGERGEGEREKRGGGRERGRGGGEGGGGSEAVEPTAILPTSGNASRRFLGLVDTAARTRSTQGLLAVSAAKI